MLARLVSNSWPQAIPHFNLLKCWDYRCEPTCLASLVSLVCFNLEWVCDLLKVLKTFYWHLAYPRKNVKHVYVQPGDFSQSEHTCVTSTQLKKSNITRTSEEQRNVNIGLGRQSNEEKQEERKKSWSRVPTLTWESWWSLLFKSAVKNCWAPISDTHGG